MKFTADRYTATKFDTAADKAKFANHYVSFVEADFPRAKFPKWFYTRLSMTFSHIAHYNQEGFYSTWFTTTADKIKFLTYASRHGCYGSPAFTYSDVEKDLARWIETSGLIEKYQAKLGAAVEVSERATLDRLKAKYEGVPK